MIPEDSILSTTTRWVKRLMVEHGVAIFQLAFILLVPLVILLVMFA